MSGLIALEGEKLELLRLARSAIVHHFRGAGRPAAPAPAGLLAESRGAFVTLSERETGTLRGCIGRVRSPDPLADVVAQLAVAAATLDERFDAIRETEVEAIAIEISVLSEPAPIRAAEVEPGRHGLIVTSAGYSGLLLPQVATEHGWDRETFLSQTCRKAGLPRDAWRHAGTELLAFTALVFGERETRRVRN